MGQQSSEAGTQLRQIVKRPEFWRHHDSGSTLLLLAGRDEHYELRCDVRRLWGSPQTLSGSYEVPLWNYAQARPNPNGDFDSLLNGFYHWLPGSGPVVHFEYNAVPGGTLNFYYAQMLPGGNSISGTTEAGATPLAALRLLESILGSGPEYGSAFASQQILYPHYAGVGSDSMDLGASGMAPAVRLEVLGSLPFLPSGDADFADMVEDIFGKIGAQAAFASAESYTPLQYGLACYNDPGTRFGKAYQFTAKPPDPTVVAYDQPNTAGNILLCGASIQQGYGPVSISDSAGNMWTPVFTSTDGTYQLWYAIALAAERNVVTVETHSDVLTEEFAIFILEIAGVDTFDAAATTTESTVSIETTNAAGTPAFIVGFLNYTGNGQIQAIPTRCTGRRCSYSVRRRCFCRALSRHQAPTLSQFPIHPRHRRSHSSLSSLLHRPRVRRHWATFSILPASSSRRSVPCERPLGIAHHGLAEEGERMAGRSVHCHERRTGMERLQAQIDPLFGSQRRRKRRDLYGSYRVGSGGESH